MSFSNVGFGTLPPGASQRWSFAFGRDMGTQYITAHPLNPGGDMLVFDHSKKMENNGSFTYFVTVRNIGSVTSNFNWQGGGVV
jgi:hypothetical protein